MTTTATLNLYRGDSRTFRCTATDAAGAPVNIGDNLLRFSVKKKEDLPDAQALIMKASSGFADGAASQIVIVGAPANGVFDVFIVPTDTYGKEPGRYYYDVQVGIGTAVYTGAKGIFNLWPDVTYRYV